MDAAMRRREDRCHGLSVEQRHRAVLLALLPEHNAKSCPWEQTRLQVVQATAGSGRWIYHVLWLSGSSNANCCNSD